MKKNGIILTVNSDSGYVILTGRVVKTMQGEKNGDDWYQVTMEYDEDGETKRTVVCFWNDRDATDFKRYRADRAKAKKLRTGSIITVRCKFRDASKKEATGYSIHYDGLILVKADLEHDRDDRSVLIGTVTSIKDITVRGQNALKLNVYAGRERRGAEVRYRNIAVTLTGDLAIMAASDLAGHTDENGTEYRKNVVFRCGTVSTYYPPAECPVCGEQMQYDPESGQMHCGECGVAVPPDEDEKRESVFGYDYFVTGEYAKTRR